MRPDRLAGIHRRTRLLKLEAAITGPEVDALGLRALQALRDEIADELRPPRVVQGELLGGRSR
jgi:hypothetical protein